MFFLWRLGDNGSSQVSWTLLCIIFDLNYNVVWMVTARPRIFNYFCSLFKPLGIVSSTSVTTGITVLLMFPNAFRSKARSKYLFLFSITWIFIKWSTGTEMSLCYHWLSLALIFCLAFRDLVVSQNPRELCASFSRTDSGLCIKLLDSMFNFNFIDYSL